MNYVERHFGRGRGWSCPSRPRVDTAPHQDKLRWEMVV